MFPVEMTSLKQLRPIKQYTCIELFYDLQHNNNLIVKSQYTS